LCGGRRITGYNSDADSLVGEGGCNYQHVDALDLLAQGA
jgi:hypothetical protein